MSIGVHIDPDSVVGWCVATMVADTHEEQDEVLMLLTTHAYESKETEQNKECRFDINIEWAGAPPVEKPLEGLKAGYENHRIWAGVSLNKHQARALRDQINAFLEME